VTRMDQVLPRVCLATLSLPKVSFVKPMLLTATERLPEGPEWSYELKFDGFRAIAVKTEGRTLLRSRNNSDLSHRFREIANALHALPDGTVLDGELVGLDGHGRPSLPLLQSFPSSRAPLRLYVFDLLAVSGNDVTRFALAQRRRLLQSRIVPVLSEPIRFSATLEAPVPDIVHCVRNLQLEGIVAKRNDSLYFPGIRSTAWKKMRMHPRC
jgi:ATP-dependent DNA ligase